MDGPYYWAGSGSSVPVSHLYRLRRPHLDSYHNRYLPAYIRAVHALPSAPPPRLPTPPPPLSPPPPGSILTAIPWLVKELTGELFGLPTLDPNDNAATTPLVRPTTPLPPPPPSPSPPSPPSPPLQTLPTYGLHPYYQSVVPTRLIIPSFAGQKIIEGTRIRIRTPSTVIRPEVEVVDWFQNGRRRTEKIKRRKFWLSRNGTVSVAVSDPAAPSVTNTVTWSEVPMAVPTEDLPPIKIPILSGNLFAGLV